MKLSRGWGRNSGHNSVADKAREIDIQLVNDAEYLLLVRRGAINRFRHGFSLDSVCRALTLPADNIMLALRFGQSSSALQLGALVEDWTSLRIKAALDQLKFVHKETISIQ